MNKSSISIIVVSYHNIEDIKNLISSIEYHTSANLEKKIIILDNGNTPNKFKKIVNDYRDVEYINLFKNLGFGRAHNYLLGKIKTKYIALVNPDVIFTEDSLTIMLDELEKNADDKVLVPKIVSQTGELQHVYRRELTLYDFFVRVFFKNDKHFKKRKKYHTMQDMNYSKSFKIPFAQGSFLLMPTKLFEELRGFDERFFMYVEDADFCKRVNQISNVYYTPKTSVIHIWEKGSHNNIKLLKYHVESIVKYFKKWGWRIK
ncbi:glycosyltransferase family 2 protein [Enterococcus casseliflavus]|uniref:glycosyltransferase family 2 protein n=1 Tax=Enterococcus casseliflavus TaxID=37734 RepID=UPI0017815463|nr:glycosyltransferase family 2 protein [Enterococcus casseliflavus]QOG30491.1 glycosyltransferase family 2 protein [Enterococcus casseliflavus]